MKQRFFRLFAAAVFAAAAAPHFGTYADAETVPVLTEQDFVCGQYVQGRLMGTHEFTNEVPGGPGCFECAWRDVPFHQAEKSLCFGLPVDQSYLQQLKLDYEAEITAEGDMFYGVHGWITGSTLCEYYIADGWNTSRPPSDTSGYRDTADINGKTYMIYEHTCTNAPSIEGRRTYRQIWSAAAENALNDPETAHVSGTVDLCAHLAEWKQQRLLPDSFSIERFGFYTESRGIQRGNTEGSLRVEKADYSLRLTSEIPKQEADENGVFFTEDFENSVGKWIARGSDDPTDPVPDSRYCAEGARSLYVEGPENTMCGPVFSLMPYAVRTDEEYVLQAAVMQNFKDDLRIYMTLEYIDENDEFNHLDVFEDSQKGEWCILRLDAFRLKPVLRNFHVYFDVEVGYKESPPLWIDSMTFAKAGCEPEIDLSQAKSPEPDPVSPDEFREGWTQYNEEDYYVHERPSGVLEGSWFQVQDCGFRSGMKHSVSKSIGQLNVYDVSYVATIESDGIIYYGVSGQILDPSSARKNEFYVIEGWDGCCPLGEEAELLGNAEINGVQYDLYFTVKTEAGGKPLQTYQYWSVRHDNPYRIEKLNDCRGTVSLLDHIRAWETIDTSGKDWAESKISQTYFELKAYSDSSGHSFGVCTIWKPEFNIVESANTEAAIRTGDANCDGIVDVSDAVLVMRYAVEDREAAVTEQGLRNADADKNGRTDESDATMILQHLAKKITLS